MQPMQAINRCNEYNKR